MTAFLTQWRVWLVLLVGVLTVSPAWAHPHIFIDAKVTVVFDANGAVAELKHDWTFDQAFSSWVIQGLDTNGDRSTSPEELQALADDNLAGLAQYQFYTFAGSQDALLTFQPAGAPRMVYENERTTLSYNLRTIDPKPIDGTFELGVYDPEYYVAITFAGAGSVTLENAPPGCAVSLEPPREMAPEVQSRLYALGPDVTELPPDLAAAMRGTQGLIRISCGAAPPVNAQPAQTALDAVTAVATAPAVPFGGPPPEVSIPLPRSGFFGWVQAQQRDFYAAINTSLGALKTDWTAFWVMGALSFLYGVFHAAGPGHGKVVIGSYMLANETQVRRGIALSALSALLQSLVAIGFVLIAAGILGVTSVAMGDAANWIGIASYGLVVALGLWLVARKLLGFGHTHDHGSMARKAHGHLHDDAQAHSDRPHDHHHHEHHSHDVPAGHHGHHHVVTADAVTGNWREQMGVVFAVGLRPCSGALVVLVFALSQGLLVAGMVAVLLMGVGTALTVATLATLAVSAKGLARWLGGADNAAVGHIVWWAELAGAFAVLAFGIVLLIASL